MKRSLQHLLLQCVCRFKMRPFLGGELDEPIRAPLHSHFGNMTLQLYPPLIKQDFYQQYHQPTFWPYCSSLEECVVYRWAWQLCAGLIVCCSLASGISSRNCWSVCCTDRPACFDMLLDACCSAKCGVLSALMCHC